MSINDSTLWENFKRGDESSFALIFRTHYQAIFNYGLKLNKDRDLVEDCVQELFLELWKNRNSLGSTDQIKPYLLKSARRKIIKKINQDSKFKKLFSNILPKEEYAFEIVLSPENQVISQQISEEKILKAQSLLDTLPPRQKEILYLLFYQEMSYEEIAKIMDINYQSARNLVHRALKLLRESA